MPSFVLFLGVAVLWLFPLWAFRAPKSRLGNFDQRGWPGGRNLALLFLDAIRAAVGGALLLRAIEGIGWADDWRQPVTIAAALAVAVVVQALSWRDEDYLFSPLAFALGAILPFAHPLLLLLTLPAAIGGCFAFRGWAGGFWVGGLVLAGTGFLMPGSAKLLTLLIGPALILPTILSVVLGRHMGGLRR